jgi:hypothetical protein
MSALFIAVISLESHLYQKSNGKSYFSMLAPAEWGHKPPHTFMVSYQLEMDMSWTAVEKIANRNEETEGIVKRLLKD